MIKAVIHKKNSSMILSSFYPSGANSTILRHKNGMGMFFDSVIDAVAYIEYIIKELHNMMKEDNITAVRALTTVKSYHITEIKDDKVFQTLDYMILHKGIKNA